MNRTHNALFDATWTAWVQYKKDFLDEQEQDSDYESSEDEKSDNTSNTQDQNYDQIDEN